MLQVTSASSEWRDIYDSVWRNLRDLFYDRPALSNWSQWRHRFDEQLTDLESTRRCIGEMVASLGDQYTFLKSQEDVSTALAKENDCKKLVMSEDLDDGIGYLRVDGFGQLDVVQQFQRELEKIAHLQGFLINLTCNAGGFVDRMLDCLEMMVPSGPLFNVEEQTPRGLCKKRIWLTAKKFCRETVNPDGSVDLYKRARQPNMIGGKPLVIYLDGDTMSSGELFALGLLSHKRKGGAIAIGERSHGKGIGQNTFKYPHGIFVKISRVRLLSDKGVWLGDCGRTEANGIEPNVRISGFKPAIQYGFKYLKGKIAQPASIISTPHAVALPLPA